MLLILLTRLSGIPPFHIANREHENSLAPYLTKPKQIHMEIATAASITSPVPFADNRG